MRITIVVDDNVVMIEGQAETVDCSSLLPQDVHVIQWYGTHGEVEYATDIQTGHRKGNDKITDITPYQYLVDAWTVEAKKVPPPPSPPPDPMDVWDAITLKIVFAHENRIRALEGKPAITVAQFKNAIKNMANP